MAKTWFHDLRKKASKPWHHGRELNGRLDSRRGIAGRILGILILALLFSHSVFPQTRVSDIFGRSLNDVGIALVDWDGYMANPLIKVYLLPPTNAALPGSVILSADNSRIYFGSPSAVSTSGPATSFSVSDPTNPIPVSLSIFPAHQDLDADSVLTMVFTDANNVRQTNTLPIHVIDEDTHHFNDFLVTVNFDRDVTGFFTNAIARSSVQQAANDWAYYFANMNLDPVLIGTEATYIWSNNFNGGYYFNNTNEYTGYQLYAYGTTNAALRSGGEGNFNGGNQASGGVPLTIHRSGGFEANIVGNYNTLYWLFLTNDNDWLATDNYGNHTNDFFSIAHHEIGHALIFNEAHPGFAAALANGGFTSYAVTNYYGGPVPIDASDDHLTGVIDPESGQGAFGWEYYGNIPRYRWTMTKLDLLCAAEVGYTLRDTSAFAPFAFPVASLADASQNAPYNATLTAKGGIPIYDWEIVNGNLPPGMVLDPFTGTISGGSSNTGSFSFTVRVRDYHENRAGLTQDLVLNVNSTATPARLAITIVGEGVSAQSQIKLYGSIGQRHIIETSADLSTWTPLVTNTLTTNIFLFTDPSPLQTPARFYRSVYTQ